MCSCWRRSNFETSSKATRYFSGLGASNAINYDYNLSGELKSVTNQWGAQVGYTHDKTGHLSAVTGTGYAGVSSYITSLAYRASGAAKQVNYGNGRQLAVAYDSRLRPIQWAVWGVFESNYFYDDFIEKSGRVTFAQSLVDATLDREYDYDHVGRLVEGHTGAEARAALSGQGAPADGAYAHSYRYDEWGNMWARVGWGGANASYSASYTNSRRDGLGYDAAGNVVNDGGQSFQYDAAGKQTYALYGDLQQSYDGDGLRVKKVENGSATYYVRSSVLGGQVVCEINGWGGWTRGYVYLGEQLLAIQDGQVIFVHQDPVTKSQRLTDTAGNVVSGVELDPWGGETTRSWNQGRQPHQFTSYERDQNASDDAQARRYNRWWSRFDQPDPFDGSYNLADPQSFNRYSYTQNDPVNFTDPTGLVLYALITGTHWYRGNTYLYSTISSISIIDTGAGGGGRHVPAMEIGNDEFIGGGGGGDVSPQTTQQRDNRTVCDRMADDAQRLANDAINGNPMSGRPDLALGTFNKEFGMLTFGSYFTPSTLGFVGTWASGRDNVLGNRDYQGDSGFPSNFRDTVNPGEDQAHHVGAYFSAGITGHKFASDRHRADDRANKNYGDVQLADQSRRLGDYLRRNPSLLSNIGKLMRDAICNGGAVPK